MLPPGLPLHAALQTAFYAARPIEFLELCERRYGDAFKIHTLMFGEEACFSHPEVVKQIFTGDPEVFRAGEANAPLEPLLGPRSVLLLDGAEHLRQRRLLMPPLHGDRMTAYGKTMIEVTERTLAGLGRGVKVKVHPFMQRITLEVILRTVFGVENEERTRALGEALVAVLDRQTSALGALTMLPALRHELFGLSPYGMFKRDVARADELIFREIAARRAQAPGQDVLSLLLQARDEAGQAMTDRELRDELVTLLTAGHETTATALSWAFDRLAHDARVQGRLRAEIDAAVGDAGGSPGPASLARLPYLDATIKEVLRLFPVVPAVGRRIAALATIGGFDLPKGTLVIPLVYLANRHPSAYERPSSFFPDRFLDKKPDPYAWIPFGGGIRRCIGMAFALYEMKAVLATALAKFEVLPAHTEPAGTTLRAFTHAPKGGGEVILAPRRRARAERAAAAFA
jgi:cytochrome P450